MQVHELSAYVALQQDINPISLAAAATTDGQSVDMQQYDGCLFLLSIGAISTAEVVDFKITHDPATGGAFANDVTGALITQLTDTEADKLVAVDVHGKLPNRFLRGELTIAGTTIAVLAGLVSVRYRGRRAPVTQGADVQELVSVALT